MRKYDDMQKAAISSKFQHIALIAGAGSGKTTVLIQKIKEILKSGVNPKKILAITFTKKASLEMKERLKNDNVLIKTFDSFCYQLLENKEKLKILDEVSIFSKKDLSAFNLFDVNLKTGNMPINYQKYVLYKKTNNFVDFNDIEYQALKIIKSKKIKYDYILIDEFQDTNLLQLKLFESLIKKDTKTFIVGDPDQSIYQFRGANNQVLSYFIKKYNSQLLFLTNNYRSTNDIVAIANSLIIKNKNRFEKKLVSIGNKNGKIRITSFKNEVEEYNYVVADYESSKHEYNSFAVLFRTHIQGFLYKKYFYDKEKVKVLSIHESKGLEFEVVYIIGVNKNVFPSINQDTNLKIEEERRLFFVAITRAKLKLLISYNSQKSKFIRELKFKKKGE